ncbi:ATP-binding protein [Nonomuraea sp. M3C6]|uniref:ATP-binding protein n=1 Tax=Nonomuraea marmarensis TaxID=3351344 RepID=A0ABW7A6V9_9ACTN
MRKRFLAELVVPGVDWAVPVVRHCIGRTLTAAGHRNVDNAQLVVSELVSNAFLHSRSARPGGVIVVEIAEIGDTLARIEVMDEGAGTIPHPRVTTEDACHGRGLWLVQQTAARWGIYRDTLGGNVVWAECSTTDGPTTNVLDAPTRAREM